MYWRKMVHCPASGFPGAGFGFSELNETEDSVEIGIAFQ
jgi:hypothetical protein